MQQKSAAIWKADAFPNDPVAGRFREILVRRGYHLSEESSAFRNLTATLSIPAPEGNPNVVLYCADSQEPALVERELASLRETDPGVFILLLGGKFDAQLVLDCLDRHGVRDYFAPGSQRQVSERIANAANPNYSYASDDFGGLHQGSQVFVAMPTQFTSVRAAVDAALQRLSLKPVHADEHLAPGSIRDKAFHLIQKADLVLACVTPHPSPDSHNANVCIETGVSLILPRPFLSCIAHSTAKSVPAYIADLPRIEYDNDIDLAVQIFRRIKVKNARPRPRTPSR